MGTGIIGTIVSLVVGGTVAAVTVVGVIDAQQSPDQNPVNSRDSDSVSQVVPYGSN